MDSGKDTEDGTIIPITEWPVSEPASDVSERKGFCKRANFDTNETPESKKKIKCEADIGSDISDISDKEPLAFTRVARWWRRNKDKIKDCVPEEVDAIRNPYTKLFIVSRSSVCKEFLKTERDKLLLKLQNLDPVQGRSDIYAAIASLEDWLGETEMANQHIAQAVTLDPKNGEYEWLKEKLTRQCKMLSLQKKALADFGKQQTSSFPPFGKVERISAKTLSPEEFQRQFVQKCKPVILTDVVSEMTERLWDLDLIKELAGDCQVKVKKSIPQSVEWARLEESDSVTVKEYIHSVQNNQTDEYLFDWSLPLNCPQLAKQLTVPVYFRDNYLQKTSPGSLYHDSWPSLFVAPFGVISNLHVDAFASNFWMALFQGQKRWTFFPPEDIPFLYPVYFHSMDPVFEVDLRNPDLEKHPLLSLTHPKQCILEAGEVLFVPGGSPHFVENLTASLAVSSNFVDQSNYCKVCEELRINGLIDPRAADLLKQFKQLFPN